MLQAIRSKASSIVAKILFGLLVLSFAVWGIGDIFRNRAADTTVATVGGRKIDVGELKLEVRQDEERWRQRLNGARADFQELNRQFHIVDSALLRLINRDLIDLEINRLRLAISEDTVDELIRADPAFLNERGVFDPKRYQQIVSREHMSSPQFKAKLRADLVRQQLNLAIIAGLTPPAELVDALYRHSAERRIAEVVTLAPSAVADPGTPGDDEVKAYYQEHKDEFAVAPLISFTAGLLRVDDVAATIEVPEEKLREEYRSRIAAYFTPEQRHLQQILLPDEAKAKAAADALAAGKDFAAVAKEVAGAELDTLDLGFMKKDDLGASSKLAEIAFALKQGEPSEPIQDALGWHILRAVEVKPEETTPFEAIKDKLAKEVARDMAADRVNALERRIEDAVAGGTSFADIVQRFDMKTVKIENVDKDGRDRDGKPVEAPPSAGDMLQQAFATAKGQISQVNQLADNAGDYLLVVDNVTEGTTKPLEDARATVVQRWQQEKRAAALAQLAKDMTDEINGGKKLAEVAAARNLTPFTSEPLTRTARDPRVSPALVAAIFNAKPGVAVSARSVNGYLVAEVKELLPPDPAQKDKDLAAFADRLVAPAMRDDLLQEFDQALRNRYPVTTDDAAVARAF